MPKIGGAIFDTPRGGRYSSLRLGRKKFAIAAAHQREAALHKADGPVAQIVRFPGAIRDALLAKQCFCDAAISAAGAMRVERAKGGAQAARASVWIAR